MRDAYIVSALRTPVGRKKGSLADIHSADLVGSVLKATFENISIDPGLVEDVIYGCVDTVGPQAGDIARTCWLVAGLPEHVPGTTVDRQCGSSQQAVHFATQAVMSGTSDVVIYSFANSTYATVGGFFACDFTAGNSVRLSQQSKR